MHTFSDEQGRRWTAEGIGRTSGIVNFQADGGSPPEPADIVRFTCQSDANEEERETTIKAGILMNSSDEDLIPYFEAARRIKRR
jgi:hypothetical protein